MWSSQRSGAAIATRTSSSAEVLSGARPSPLKSWVITGRPSRIASAPRPSPAGRWKPRKLSGSPAMPSTV